MNAIRHTGPTGTVEITLRASDDPAPRTAELSVPDECGGIAEQDLDAGLRRGLPGRAGPDPAARRAPAPAWGWRSPGASSSAHEGSVEVCNADGGCEFIVRLPLAS